MWFFLLVSVKNSSLMSFHFLPRIIAGLIALRTFCLLTGLLSVCLDALLLSSASQFLLGLFLVAFHLYLCSGDLFLHGPLLLLDLTHSFLLGAHARRHNRIR